MTLFPENVVTYIIIIYYLFFLIIFTSVINFNLRGILEFAALSACHVLTKQAIRLKSINKITLYYFRTNGMIRESSCWSSMW